MASATTWSVADEIQERYRHIAGTPVEHDVRPYFGIVDRLDAAAVENLSDDELRTTAAELRKRGGSVPFDDLLAETFALTRELARRELGLRPYDVQMAAGVALARGRLVQLATGEGKTLAAVAPA